MAEQYTSLNDAQHISPILSEGDYKIYYRKMPSRDAGSEQYEKELRLFRDFGMGKEFLENIYDLNDLIDNIDDTHVLIGSIKGSDNLENIMRVMQGEIWSPRGEAWNMIANNDTHTSMSVGDLIVTPSGEVFIVDMFGFDTLCFMYN